MFLPISLRDDQTTIGIGLTSNEFTIQAGILHAESREGPWHLDDDYMERMVYFFGDVATLVNYSRFVKQMSKDVSMEPYARWVYLYAQWVYFLFEVPLVYFFLQNLSRDYIVL